MRDCHCEYDLRGLDDMVCEFELVVRCSGKISVRGMDHAKIVFTRTCQKIRATPLSILALDIVSPVHWQQSLELQDPCQD